MSLWSSLLDVLKTIPAQTILTFAGAVIGAVIAFLGVAFGQYLTHRYTQRRECEKLLREKAEELIHTLCQIEHSLFIWHEGLVRDARFPRPPQEGIIGNRSMESYAASVVKFGTRSLPEPGEYQTLLHSIHLDLQRTETLQRLYFLSVQSYYEAYTSALFLLVEWLVYHMTLQEEGSSHWPEQFHAEDTEKWPQLHNTYDTAHAEILGAFARTILPYREPPRALSLLRRRR